MTSKSYSISSMCGREPEVHASTLSKRTLVNDAEAWLSVTGSHKHREATRTPCSRISPNATCTTILYLGIFCALE